MSIKKGVAFTLIAVMIDKNGAPDVGSNVTAVVQKDGGSPASSINTPSEVDITTGKYKLILTSDEMNADVVHILFTSDGTDVANVGFNLITQIYINNDIYDYMVDNLTTPLNLVVNDTEIVIEDA